MFAWETALYQVMITLTYTICSKLTILIDNLQKKLTCQERASLVLGPH